MEDLGGLVGDLEADLEGEGDLVGDLEGDFGDGELREAEKEFRAERELSLSCFSCFSLSLSFLKMWASWTIGGGDNFFLIEGGRIGEISCEPRDIKCVGPRYSSSLRQRLQIF